MNNHTDNLTANTLWTLGIVSIMFFIGIIVIIFKIAQAQNITTKSETNYSANTANTAKPVTISNILSKEDTLNLKQLVLAHQSNLEKCGLSKSKIKNLYFKPNELLTRIDINYAKEVIGACQFEHDLSISIKEQQSLIHK